MALINKEKKPRNTGIFCSFVKGPQNLRLVSYFRVGTTPVSYTHLDVYKRQSSQIHCMRLYV